MRSNLFAKHLQTALAKPNAVATESQPAAAPVVEPTVEPAVAVTPAVESEPAAPAPAAPAPAPAPQPSPAPAPAPIASTESEPTEGVISAPNGGTETVVVDEVPHMVEHHLIAADHVGDHIDTVHDECCDLHRAITSLESVINAVELEPNGLDQTSARFVTLAVESITGRWSQGLKLVPSIESFGGPTSRREATITTESNVKEVVKQIVAFLKNLASKFIELLKKFWEHIHHGADALKKKAQAVKAKFEGKQIATESLTYALEDNALLDRHLASRIAVAGKIPAFHELADISKRIMAGDFKQSEEDLKLQREIGGAIAELLGANGETFDAAYARAEEAIKKAEESVGKVPGGLFTQEGGKRTEWVPGGIAYEIEYHGNGVLNFKKIHWDGPVETKVVQVPSSEAVVKFATDVEEIAGQIQAHLQTLKDFEKVTTENVAAVEGNLRDNGGLTEAQIHKASKLFATANQIVIGIVKLASNIHYDVLAALSAALDFVGHLHADNFKEQAVNAGEHSKGEAALQAAKAATESQTDDAAPAVESQPAVEPCQEPKAGNTADNPGGGEGSSQDADVPTQEPAAGATATDPGKETATGDDAPAATEAEASQIEEPKPAEASQLEPPKAPEASQLPEPKAPEASQLAEPKPPQGGPGL